MPHSTAPRPDVVALLRACKELPDEDVHRLVLSDWLEENSDDPSELALRDLIRLQVEFARATDDEVRRSLASESSKLLAQHGKAWLGTLDTDRVNWGLVHGLFVMTCHEEDLSRNNLGKPGFPEGWAWVERLTVLGTSMSDWKRMAQASALTGIGTLDLRRNSLRRRGAQALANSSRLGELCGLNLAFNELGRDGLQSILSSPSLGGLVRLELDSNGLDAQAMTDLARWPRLAAINRLSLSGNPIDEMGLVALMRAPDLGNLRELQLANCQIGALGIAALAGCQAPLISLDLSRNSVGTLGMQELLSARWLPDLRCLRLAYTGMTDYLVEALAVGMADDVVEALAACERLTGLKELDLQGVRANRSALTRLVRSPALAGLERLTLTYAYSEHNPHGRLAPLPERPGLTVIY
jgi:uncharacterized protein (TIGR02996 family)